MAVSQFKLKDEQLFAEVQKLMNGNFESYEKIYELSKHYIYKIINDIVQNHHTTEDMMQETYLQIYNKIGTLREARTFYVWAGRIASNLTLRYLQKYRKEVLQAATEDEDGEFIFDNVVNDDEAFIPGSVLENEEQQRIIAGIMDSLSPEQKLTVQYYYFEELSVGDIANLMECSTGTVKSRLNYARKSLKTAVSEFEVKHDVKLYSMASLPVFFMVFRRVASGLLATGVGATVAGGAVATGASVGGGSVSAGSASVGAGSVAGGSAVTGVGATAGASGAAGTVAGGSIIAGTAATTGGTVGVLGSIAGKIVAVATAIAVGVGSSGAAASISENRLVDDGSYEQVYEEAEEALSDLDVPDFLGELFEEDSKPDKDKDQDKDEEQMVEGMAMVEFVLYRQLAADDELSDKEIEKLKKEYLKEVEKAYQAFDEDGRKALDNAAAAIVRVCKALEKVYPNEEAVAVGCFPEPMESSYYFGEMMLTAYLQAMGAMILDESGYLKETYYKEYTEYISLFAEWLDANAQLFEQKEVRSGLQKYWKDAEEMSIFHKELWKDIKDEVSAEVLEEIIRAEEMLAELAKIDVAMRMENDPVYQELTNQY